MYALSCLCPRKLMDKLSGFYPDIGSSNLPEGTEILPFIVHPSVYSVKLKTAPHVSRLGVKWLYGGRTPGASNGSSTGK